MEKIELRDKWVDYLLFVHENENVCQSDVGKAILASAGFCWAHKLTVLLVDCGLVEKRVEGRRCPVVLTKKGMEVAEHLKKVKYLLQK